MGRFPLFQKKEKWTLTWRGRVLQLAVVTLLVILYVKGIVPFLSPTAPAESSILVVEGYVPDYALEESAAIFMEGGYDLMLITGKPREKGAHLDQYANDGDYSAAILAALGQEKEKMQVVAIGDDVTRDRTYYSALAVREWLREHSPGTTSVDLVSFGTHARRSRLLFQKAMGDEVTVGVFAIASRSYDPGSWWRSSHGFREVNKETIAWVYARFFFWP